MLLPSVPAPASRRYKRDFFEARLVQSFGSIPAQVSSGQAIERAAAELGLHNDVFMDAFPSVCLDALCWARPPPPR